MFDEKSSGYKKNPGLVRDINRLWLPAYPGLARQVAEMCICEPKRILELGCFSGGTGLEFLKIFPEAELTIAIDMPELIASFRTDWNCAEESRVMLQELSLNKQISPGKKYDLIFCRGAFFFMDPDVKIVGEMFNCLAAGGAAFWGGGYGIHTPEHIIAEIGDESRIKNNALGRKIYSVELVRKFLQKSGVAERSEVIEDGGLWVLMRNEALEIEL